MLLNGIDFELCKMRGSGHWLHDNANVFDATELYT